MIAARQSGPVRRATVDDKPLEIEPLRRSPVWQAAPIKVNRQLFN
jgi:hypothetical protein